MNIEEKRKIGLVAAWTMLVISVLLILTALGNAYVMLVAAIFGIGVALVCLGRKQNNWAVAIAGCAVAIAIACLMTFK